MKIENIKTLVRSSLFHWSFGVHERCFRLTIIALLFFCGYGIVIYKLFDVSLSKNSIEIRYAEKVEKNRRDIVDRNGNLLATNLPIASLYANPKKIIDPELTINKLAIIYPHLDKEKLSIEFKKDKTFVWISRDLTPQMQDQIVGLGLPGLYFEIEQKRVYTQGKSTSHILGFVDRDNNGIAGIERYFDKELAKSHDTSPLELSIDYRVQNILSQELDAVIAKFSAIGGVAIVADVNTGEVLGMVSKPDFDPHKASSASPEQLFNRSTLGLYEIGSAIKAVTFAIAFDTNTIQMNDVYNIGNFTVNKFKVKDYHKHDGWNTVPQLFMNSSNIGAGMIALEVGKKNFKDYMARLSMNKPLSLEVPEVATPRFPSDKKLSDLSLVTMSYGYGFSITPMHFVQGMIPIVNGGYKHNTTLLKKHQDNIQGEKVLEEETSMNMLKLMRLTVAKGTGKKAAVKGYLVAGKTGTANKLGPKGYLNNSRFSSFIATAPSINPKFVVFVFLDDPQGIKETYGFATAGFTAAPVAGNIIFRIGSLYGIQPYNEDDEEIQNMMHVNYEVENET